MCEGYEIVEPTSLVGLMRDPTHHELAVFLLSWLATQLKAKFTDAIFDVLYVTYMDSYPALGVHYLNPTAYEDIDFAKVADNILGNASVESIVQFAISSPGLSILDDDAKKRGKVDG